MKKSLSIILILSLLFLNLFGCQNIKNVLKKEPESPFTTDFKTTEENIKFYTEGDELELLMASSPFYAGSHPLPGQKTSEFDQARKAKVDDIKKQAASVITTTEKIRPKVDKLRDAYLDYLTAVFKEEPKLEKYIKEVFPVLSSSYTKAIYARDQYRSIDTKNAKNAYSKSLFDYLKVSRAQENGYLTLEDLGNIGSFAADTLSILKDHKSAKILEENKKLDQEMKAIEELSDDLKKISDLLKEIDYGIKQLASADYYFAKESDAFIMTTIPDLKAKLKELKPNENLTAEQIEFVKTYLALFEEWQKELQNQLKRTEKDGIIKTEEKASSGIGVAYAGYAPAGSNYGSGLMILKAPLAPPVSQETESGVISATWDTIKSGINKLRTGAGVGLDIADTGVKNIATGVMNKWYGVPFSETWKDAKKNVNTIFENYEKGTSGANVLTTAGEYMEGIGTGAEELAKGTIDSFAGKESWKGWVAGKVAKATVGMFTDFAKGTYKLLNTQSSGADIAEGLFDVTTSMIGGSKVILKGSQIPGLAKELAKQGVNTGKLGLSYLASALNAKQIKQLTKEMIEMMAKNKMTQEEIKQLVINSMKIETKEIVEQVFKEAREKLIKEMKKALKEGGEEALKSLSGGIKESMDEVFKITFEKNYKGLWDALKQVVTQGQAKKFLDNMMGEMVDDLIKETALEVLRSTPESQELGGGWKGTAKIVNLIYPEGAKEDERKACDSVYKGKVFPLTINMPAYPTPSGNCTIVTGADSAAAKYTYSEGNISFSASGKGYTMSMKGNVGRLPKGGFAMGGSLEINYQLIKMIGNWNASGSGSSVE